ncbi:MAG: YeeE/YedE thiosulfate transporter family protein [Ilumatobacteraceae bacterium]
MIASAPFIPLNGGSPTLYALLALLVGTGFGFFLERAGFGSAKKLTSVFTLRDWQVYKVMFTALITALVGSQILSGLGMLDLSLVEVGSTMLLPMAVGGLLFGVGFYFGGFCPGTAVVSAVRGRLDAVVFLVGVLGGMYAFAVFFDGPGQADWFQSFYQPVGSRVMHLYGTIPVWALRSSSRSA